jgi:hypothetical protein
VKNSSALCVSELIRMHGKCLNCSEDVKLIKKAGFDLATHRYVMPEMIPLGRAAGQY